MTIQTIKSEIIDAVQRIDNRETLNSLKKHVDSIENGDNRHSSVSYSEEERVLVEQAQEGLPKNKWQRFLELENKQRAETIIKSEMEELLQLSDMLEVKDSERIEAMMKLADIWSISLEEVKIKLNIQTPELYVW